jgi:hypothetical protein
MAVHTRSLRCRPALSFAVLFLLSVGAAACSSSSGSEDDASVDSSHNGIDHGLHSSDIGPGPRDQSGDAPESMADAGELDECDDPGLTWNTANKTNYTSYPEPGSQECVEFNGCMWEGLFAGCDGKQTEAWVEAHDIAAVFPDFNSLEHHRLCLRSGNRRMIVHVLDTCADSDCSGCCSENRGSADALIDLESYTNARWGLEDGPIEWADLGEAPSPCD